MTSRKTLIPMALCFVATAAFAPAGRAQDSQTSQPSVADASRKAKAQQKNEPKTAKVFTDEDVANLKGGISVVGAEPTPAPADAAATPADGKAAAQPVKNEAYWRKRFADARRALADDTKEEDVLQREYNLKQVQFYSNPNEALREQYSRKDLDDTLAQINTKKQDIDKDNQVLSDLQDELRTSGGEPGWADAESQPASQTDSDASQPSSQPDQQASPAPNAPQTQQQPDPSAAPATSQPQQ